MNIESSCFGRDRTTIDETEDSRLDIRRLEPPRRRHDATQTAHKGRLLFDFGSRSFRHGRYRLRGLARSDRRLGGRIVRRCTSIEEILRYSSVHGGILTRGVFSYDPVLDAHAFRGRNNSYLLETKIAMKMGLADPREIYKDIDKRAKVIERMVEAQIFDYDDERDLFRTYSTGGFDALPPELVE